MGRETSKALPRRVRDHYFDRYLVGAGIDIGCGDDPLTPDCLRWDRAEGDAATLPGLTPGSFDWVYSSHCLEDLPQPQPALARWWELLCPGGHLLLVVPDEDLYEQGQWPSRFNGDHRWTFTLHKSRSWSPVSLNLLDLVRELPSHHLLWARHCDDRYDYSGGVWDRTHGPAEAALEVMVRKIGDGNGAGNLNPERLLGGSPEAPPYGDERHGPTVRQVEVLHAMSVYGDTRRAAAHLGLSRHTVRAHLSALRRKLGLHSTPQMIHWCYQHGALFPGREEA
jgi:DNA-binding CsgD family transcriptional regulator